MGITAGRISYTEHLPGGDPLDGGTDFYDPVVVELLVCSLLMIGISIFLCVPFMVFYTRMANILKVH